MKPWLAFVMTVAVGCSSIPHRAPAEILRDAEPRNLAWTASQRLDLDCDGIADDVLTAQDEQRFYVGVVLGASHQKDRYSIVAFALGGDWQESFCGEFESLTPEPLSSAMADATGEEELGYVATQGCLGLKLVAGECDSFHLYWNRMSNALDWWRV